MFKNLRKGFFPSLIAFSALSVSASAAFYSVSGLSKLFAGASFEVIIMAGSLEVAKLVIASLLYQYWDTINKWLRAYLSMATIILVLITSMGIYGFLSAAYQETYSKLLIQENEIEFIENKAQFYEADLLRYDTELARISENINILSNAKASGIQVRDTTSSTGFRQTISTTELRMAQKRIETEEVNRKEVQVKRQVAADSLQTFRLQILDLQNTSETAGELGPLQYLSGLTGTPMDKIINWLLLVIIFVFDPLAISLVVAANFAFAQAFPKREDEETLHTDSIWTDIEDRISEDDEEDHYDAYVDRQAPEEEEWDEEHALDQVLNNMVEDLDEDDFLDNTPPRSTKPTMDISINHEDAEKWNQLADELAKGTVEMQEDEENENAWLDDPDVQAFLENEDKPGPWPEEYDKPNLVAGMTNDLEGSFMEFQNQMDAADAELEAAAEELQELEEDVAREIEVIDPKEVSSKWEVEDTSGNVTVHEESDSEFPNENNPTSVAATVAEIQNRFGTYPSTVEKLETPHLPKTETTTAAPVVKKVVKKTDTPVETTTKAPINEDDLFDEAMRKKAEQDKLEFLRKKDEDSKK
tara:strand:+ start:2646 stop:4403 length:1758 start_codon:yes stop_codon:yes gene_type:complete